VLRDVRSFNAFLLTVSALMWQTYAIVKVVLKVPDSHLLWTEFTWNFKLHVARHVLISLLVLECLITFWAVEIYLLEAHHNEAVYVHGFVGLGAALRTFILFGDPWFKALSAGQLVALGALERLLNDKAADRTDVVIVNARRHASARV
jgi:hypothetical protein